MNRKLCTTLIVLLSVLILVGCEGTTIPAVSQDLTPPVAKLDLYGIPGDGSFTPPPYESMNSQCCDQTRKAGLNDKIDLVASGEDKDGGIQSISIKATIFLTCKKGDLLTGEFYHDLQDVTITETKAAPGESTSTFRVAQGSMQHS
jgi:hypothetical protein